MTKIIATKQAGEISKKLKSKNKTIVLVGGCFDILHKGHVEFLTNAKTKGDFIFVLLESDLNVRKYKGEGRPVNSQKKRATALSFLEAIDYVVMLPQMTKDSDYDRLVFQIAPDVISATKGDPNIVHKKRQTRKIGAKLVYVVDRIKDLSTTNILKNYEYGGNN